MYLEFFNLKEYPFNVTPDTRFLFLSTQHKEAINCLLYGITERKGFTTLTGEIGTGKTTITREVLNRLDTTIATSLVFNPLLSVDELLKSINQDFGCKETKGFHTHPIYTLNEFLLEQEQTGKNAVVFIDEAQNLSFEALEAIRMLSNLETEHKKLLQIILIGQPELERKLSSYELRQLNQRISVRYNLTPLNFKETKAYIIHRLFTANTSGELHFSDGAIKKIYEYSRGTPRLINMVCDRTLLAAYTFGERFVSKKIALHAMNDLAGRPHIPWIKKLWVRHHEHYS